ncbi:MAG: butyrate kinase [Rikenellaceae bacterium]|jgi:butyrate kinase|nr:butyrate kinase [Rikenellaceae bacterium]
MADRKQILAINPGSTSTKIALYEGENEIFEKSIPHTTQELAAFENVTAQFEYRRDLILEELAHERVEFSSLGIVVGRGGLIRPVASGVYEVNESLMKDLWGALMGEHASNLGGLLAHDIAGRAGVKAIIADPVVVDELDSVARLSGHPLFKRTSIFHALNQKSVARRYAHSLGKEYEELNLIVAHMGGGVSVGAHHKGRVIDVNNALGGEGPFSAVRAGTVPGLQLAELCFSGKYTRNDIVQMLIGKGGLVAHTGSNDAREARARAAAGDHYAQLVIEALGYNVGKSIGAMAAVLGGKVDGVLLTGGMAHSTQICGYIRRMVEFIAPVTIYPGENEMRALAHNGRLMLAGKLVPKVY